MFTTSTQSWLNQIVCKKFPTSLSNCFRKTLICVCSTVLERNSVWKLNELSISFREKRQGNVVLLFTRLDSTWGTLNGVSPVFDCSTITVCSLYRFLQDYFQPSIISDRVFFNFWLYNIILSITFNHRDSKLLNSFPTFGHVCIWIPSRGYACSFESIYIVSVI